MKTLQSCPICDNSTGTRLGEKGAFVIIKCHNCLTLFVQRNSGSKDYFDYSTYYSDENLRIPEFVNQSYRKVIGGFEKYRENGRLLDVGCGAGTLLDIATEMGWNASGVEVSRPAVEHLGSRGLNVHEGTLEEISFPDNHFDVITATEVIEHVEDPKGMLKEISRILRPQGLLWITTPHGRGLSARLLGVRWSVISPPEHLNLFSKKALDMSLREAGFAKNRFSFNGFNPFEVYQSFRTQSLNDSPNNSDIETSPEFNRVTKGYRLNKWLMSGKNKRTAKNLVNTLLTYTRMGDTIKAWAELP